MQRDLKFRMPINNADGTFKEWFYWGFYGGAFIVPHSMFGSCPSQQFTGLQDKNGVDIYEGDILGGMTHRVRLDGTKIKGSEHETPPMVVIWDVDKWATRQNLPWLDHAHTSGYLKISAEFFAVIGNTTENPELSK